MTLVSTSVAAQAQPRRSAHPRPTTTFAPPPDSLPGIDVSHHQDAIDWTKVVFNMLTIHGIYGREMYETWYQMTVMLESGLNIKPVITHRFPYTEYEQGFAAMESGNCGKVILDWTV